MEGIRKKGIRDEVFTALEALALEASRDLAGAPGLTGGAPGTSLTIVQYQGAGAVPSQTPYHTDVGLVTLVPESGVQGLHVTESARACSYSSS